MRTWQAGDTVGAYKIEAVLGSGGMATVYRAHHARLAREVAIKALHPAISADADFISRFEREARIVANLDHPHIVPVYDFNEADGQPYLVMKYIEGHTLKDAFQQGVPPLDDIMRITEALAGALTYAHGQGVLHRDIKPSNVLIDKDGTPYLTDFGLARLLQTGESTMSAGMIIGTPNYVSPEQASGEGEVTARSDVYSLGVLLYEMVVGRVPFRSDTPYATVHKHIYEPPPLPSELNPDIPAQVEMVLLRALEKDPAARYATPDDLAAAFKGAVQASGLTALSPERSRVTQAPGAAAAPPPAPADKPKRDNPNARSLLLLLDGEENWAKLPHDEIIRRRLKKRREERAGFVAHLLPYLGVNGFLLASGAFFGDGLSPFSLITPLAWGAGLASHGINVWHQSGQHVERMYRTFDEQMTDWYGSDWRNTVPEREIQRQWDATRAQFEERKSLHIHGAVYILITAMMWSIWVGTLFESGGAASFPWPLIVNLGWGVGLVSHGVKVYWDNQSTRDDESIAAELAMMQGGGTSGGKRKNEDASPSREGVRLTEDGELTESTAADFEQQQRRQRR